MIAGSSSQSHSLSAGVTLLGNPLTFSTEAIDASSCNRLESRPSPAAELRRLDGNRTRR
jgi:hypothetical protein